MIGHKTLRTILVWFFPAIIITFGVAAIGSARNCHQFFAQPVVVQQAYAPPVYYSVGQDLQTEALAEKVASLVERKLALRAALKTERETAPQTALAQNCARCHSGENAKGGLVFDGAGQLSCSTITKALRAIADGRMPKGKVIDGQTKGQLMQELLDSEPKEALPAHPKVPVPPTPSPDLE